MKDVVQRFGIRYPVILDSDHGTWNAYGIVAERAALMGAKEISFNTKPTTVIKPGSLYYVDLRQSTTPETDHRGDQTGHRNYDDDRAGAL